MAEHQEEGCPALRMVSGLHLSEEHSEWSDVEDARWGRQGDRAVQGEHHFGRGGARLLLVFSCSRYQFPRPRLPVGSLGGTLAILRRVPERLAAG